MSTPKDGLLQLWLIVGNSKPVLTSSSTLANYSAW